ncbi:MAG TPA: DUF421 domain-containing protein [Candidatus Deferrimicrobium sp.]|nr:DUF421 domain-containing protein [Candidatus Deferrimicrobium sp.]
MNEYMLTFLRALLAFITLLLLVRLIGRKQMSQMTFTDYIVGISMGSLGANLTVNKSLSIISGVIAIAAWCGFDILTSFLALKNSRMRRLIYGEPLIVINKGQIHDQNMSKSNYSINDLLMQLREKDVFDPATVDFAILEPNGQLSVLKKPEHTNPTSKDMGLSKAPQGLMTDLIIDGKVLSNNLLEVKKDEAWLREKLQEKGFKDLEAVIFAGLFTNGEFYVAPRIQNSN